MGNRTQFSLVAHKDDPDFSLFDDFEKEALANIGQTPFREELDDYFYRGLFFDESGDPVSRRCYL